MELAVFPSYNTDSVRAPVYGHSGKKMNNTVRNVNIKIAAWRRPTLFVRSMIFSGRCRTHPNTKTRARARNVGTRLQFASQTHPRLIPPGSGTRAPMRASDDRAFSINSSSIHLQRGALWIHGAKTHRESGAIRENRCCSGCLTDRSS